MTSPTSPTAAQAECLKAIEQLRLAGVSANISLPQIVVVGDQSSGKSSVLERITGAPIPSKEGLCTRWPMLLNMRYGTKRSIKISVIPTEDRPSLEKIRINKYSRSVDDLSELVSVFPEVEQLLDVGGTSRNFCNDILKIDFTDPKNMDLSLIDLPGLFQIGNRRQTSEDAKFIRDMVDHWIMQPRTVKLVVVSAKTEPVHHYSLKFLQERHQQETQTIGAITHTDFLAHDYSGQNFKDYAAILTGGDSNFKLQHDWFALNNKPATATPSSFDARERAEEEFFKHPAWNIVDQSLKGLNALNQRLINVQAEAIDECLPDLIVEAENEIAATKNQISELPNRKPDVRSIKKLVIAAAREFEKAMRNTKDSLKFNSTDPDLALQYHLTQSMTKFNFVLNSEMKKACESGDNSSSLVAQALEDCLSVSSSLPGQLDFELMSEIFYGCTKSWVSLTTDAINHVTQITRQYLLALIKTTSNGEFLNGFEAHIITPAMEKLRENLQQQVSGVLNGYETQAPVSFASIAHNQIGSVRGLHVHELYNQQRTKMMDTIEEVTISVEELSLYMNRLGRALQEAATDVDAFTIKEADKCICAHIKNEHKNLAHYFTADKIINEVLRHISALFTLDKVHDLDDDDLLKICRQTADHQAEKRLLEEKRDLIQGALEKLRWFKVVRAVVVADGSTNLKRKSVVEDDDGEADPGLVDGELEKWEAAASQRGTPGKNKPRKKAKN